ncbi:MAG: hypothetical protein GF328_14400, partial [Candidatus Latescibacteria bacterium]|nr:hypothetical protein [Candidatus Latescibacterota bacterium]
MVRTRLAAALLLLSSAALAGPSEVVGRYLAAPDGSEAEAAALSELSPLFAADPGSVEAAIREFSGFPAAAPGPRSVRVPLPDVSIAGIPVADTLAVVWVPRGYDPSRSWPAILLSHGTGGGAARLVRSLAPLADAHGYLLVCPEEEFGPRDGWGFNEYQHAMHLSALAWLKRSYNVDDSRVFVHGGSRGGHASWDLACSYPDLFAGAVPVSGILPDRHFRYLPSLRHVAVLSMQGLRDSKNLVENFRAAVKRLQGWEYDVTVREDPEAGHFFPVDWDEVAAWMEKRRRPDHPAELVVAATRDAKGRAFWVGLRDLR